MKIIFWMGGVHGTQKGGYTKIDLAIRVIGYGGVGRGYQKSHIKSAL